MSSAISESATWETSVIGPDGTDPRTAASFRTPLQDLANRTKFLKESFVDIQTGQVQAGDDYTNTSFANMSTNPTLTFTNVKIGDKIVLHAAGSFSVGTFTADGTDPSIELRWLIGGATDIYSGAGGYPIVRWGSTVGAGSDARTLVAHGVYTVAADASSLTATLQNRVTNSGASTVNTEAPVFLVGTHYRLGA